MIRLLRQLSFIVFFGLVIACDELPVDPQVNETVAEKPVKYVIPSGKHEAQQSTFVKIETQKLKFKVKFDSSAMYKTVASANQADINKLYGVSDCGTHHHTNSARFGWRWYKNQLEIWAYTYANNERKYVFIDTVALNEFQNYEIEFTANQYIFRLNSKTIELSRKCEGSTNGYKLFPYFGGDETAPHDVTIWIEDVK